MAIRKSVRKLNARLAAIAATPALLGTIAVAQDRADGSSITLDTITVDGQRTDGRDTYLRPNSGSATKTQTPVLETPQSITVITRRQLDDQNPQTVGNALRYTAGVLSEIDATTRYDSLFIRGFGGFGTSTDYVSFLDGLKLPRGQGFATQQIDPFLLDRVEVIKGPSALLYGQISPGGLVNQVSRQPSTIPYNEWRVEAGSYGRVQSGVTSQGAIDKDGRWSYSLSAIGRLSGTRYNGVDEQRIGVAPALTWRPTTDTRLTLSGYYGNKSQAPEKTKLCFAPIARTSAYIPGTGENVAKRFRTLPKYVQVENSRHGRQIFYFRRGGLRTRLPPPDDPSFHDAYRRAINSQPEPYRPARQTIEVVRKQTVERSLEGSLKSARQRALKAGKPFNITMDWLLARAEAQGFRCALTRIPFHSAHDSKGHTNPFAPSLDQIIPGKGYTEDNVRIVVFAMNVMLMDWGEAVLEHVMHRYLYQARLKRRNSSAPLSTEAGR